MTAIRAAWSRFWGSVRRRLGLNHPGWPGPPKDDTHATYRRQYETLLPTLKNLPRGVHHENAFERRNAFLYLAEILDGLHNYGDDPILPPGIRRMVIRENQTRLQAFGEVGQPSFMGRFMASLIPFLSYILIGGILLSVTGWGGAWWNGVMRDRAEAQRDEFRTSSERNAAAAREWRAEFEQAHSEVIEAQQQAAATAETLTAERRRGDAARARLRRQQREAQQVLTGGPPPDWDSSVRDAGEAAGGAAASGSGAGGSDPG
jgi:hypothetical protein